MEIGVNLNNNMNPVDYGFHGLLYGRGEIDPEGCSSLCYLVSLTNSSAHPISETLPAKRILAWLYDFEEQSINAKHLRAGEEFFSRYFVGGFYPQTPCMVVKKWSPIRAMLERGMEPRILRRETKFRALATGIWEPQMSTAGAEIESAATDEDLFWAIIGRVSNLSLERKMMISVIAQPGWDYASAINSLPGWSVEDVLQAGRILWKRTSQG